MSEEYAYGMWVVVVFKMTPVLFGAYVRLAGSEERVMLEKFGNEYSHYMAVTPGFFRRYGNGKHFYLRPWVLRMHRNEPNKSIPVNNL